MTLRFGCDPDFFAMALSYEDRDRYEGDIHVVCSGGEVNGVVCDCWCHTAEGERIYGPQQGRMRRWRSATMT